MKDKLYQNEICFSKDSIRLSEIESISDLSYMESRKIFVVLFSFSRSRSMILKPPLLPLPLLFDANLNLNKPFPRFFPDLGFRIKLFWNSRSSFFKLGNFLEKNFVSFLKLSVTKISKFIQEFIQCLKFFSFRMRSRYFFQSSFDSRKYRFFFFQCIKFCLNNFPIFVFYNYSRSFAFGIRNKLNFGSHNYKIKFQKKQSIIFQRRTI